VREKVKKDRKCNGSIKLMLIYLNEGVKRGGASVLWIQIEGKKTTKRNRKQLKRYQKAQIDTVGEQWRTRERERERE
jgi:hypothetical protein